MRRHLLLALLGVPVWWWPWALLYVLLHHNPRTEDTHDASRD